MIPIWGIFNNRREVRHMGSFSLWHWLVVLAVVLLLFGGGGKISKIMADMGKGVKGFKKGLKEEGGEGDQPPSTPTALGSSASGAASDTSVRKDETVKT
jgi:sec-independent protein translocase protein TatA